MSVFLVAGAAFAADGELHGRASETAEPTGTAESKDDNGADDASETPDATDGSADDDRGSDGGRDDSGHSDGD